MRRLTGEISGDHPLSRIRPIFAAALVALAAAIPLARPSAAIEPIRSSGIRAPAGKLTVMTYNVEGLPWPVAGNRTPELKAIGELLGQLRQRAMQPHVVLLQEAFVAEAKQIAVLAGYRYTAVGPQPGDVTLAAGPAIDADFDRAASRLKGEGDGKWSDSGLVVLSDYPIVATRRMAFPADACAGYDCLATKGVLLAWIRVPGVAAPVAIGDTHLNSRRASGVGPDRSDRAYAWQVDAVRSFIARNVSPGTPLVVGGDFNIGHQPWRVALARAGRGVVPGAAEATEVFARNSPAAQRNPDLAAVMARGKDKQYYRPARGGQLRLLDLGIPFGMEEGGNTLSDHLGFVASYGA